MVTPFEGSSYYPGIPGVWMRRWYHKKAEKVAQNSEASHPIFHGAFKVALGQVPSSLDPQLLVLFCR